MNDEKVNLQVQIYILVWNWRKEENRMLARLIGFAALTIVTVLGNIIIVIAICVEPRLKSVCRF